MEFTQHMSDAQYDLRNLCLYIWLPALWAKPTVKKPSTTLAVIDIALDYQLSVLYGTFLHQGNIGKVLVAFLWLIYKPCWFATMYCMWNKSAQKQFSFESYYQSAHHNMAKPKLWMHCLWQLPRGFKDSAISQGNNSQKFLIKAIFTCFFFFVQVAEASERKCPQSSEAPPEAQLYALQHHHHHHNHHH